MRAGSGSLPPEVDEYEDILIPDFTREDSDRPPPYLGKGKGRGKKSSSLRDKPERVPSPLRKRLPRSPSPLPPRSPSPLPIPCPELNEQEEVGSPPVEAKFVEMSTQTSPVSVAHLSTQVQNSPPDSDVDQSDGALGGEETDGNAGDYESDCETSTPMRRKKKKKLKKQSKSQPLPRNDTDGERTVGNVPKVTFLSQAKTRPAESTKAPSGSSLPDAASSGNAANAAKISETFCFSGDDVPVLSDSPVRNESVPATTQDSRMNSVSDVTTELGLRGADEIVSTATVDEPRPSCSHTEPQVSQETASQLQGLDPERRLNPTGRGKETESVPTNSGTGAANGGEPHEPPGGLQHRKRVPLKFTINAGHSMVDYEVKEHSCMSEGLTKLGLPGNFVPPASGNYVVMPGLRKTSVYFVTEDGNWLYTSNKKTFCKQEQSDCIYMRCQEYALTKTERCPAKARLYLKDTGNLILSSPHHNHGSRSRYREIIQHINVLLHLMSQETTLSIREVFAKYLRTLPPDTAVKLDFEALRSSMHRARASNWPKLPLTLEESFQRIKSDEPKWYNRCLCETHLDENEPSNGYMIFADQYALAQIRKDGGNPTVHVDATFAITPPFFVQDLVVIVWCRGLALSVFHILMTGRKQKLYMKVLERVKHLLGNTVTVKIVKADYERALKNAIEKVFGSGSFSGCFFHHVQAVYK